MCIRDRSYIQDTWPFKNLTQTYVPISQVTEGRILRQQAWIPFVANQAAFVD